MYSPDINYWFYYVHERRRWRNPRRQKGLQLCHCRSFPTTSLRTKDRRASDLLVEGYVRIHVADPELLRHLLDRARCSFDTQEGEYGGETKGGVREGKGQLVWSNGDTYQGDFHNGLRHGQGVQQNSKS